VGLRSVEYMPSLLFVQKSQALIAVALRCAYVNGFYRAMHFSAKGGIAIACRLSVRLSVCLSVCL